MAGPLLTVTAQTSSGTPVPGLQLFATYGDLIRTPTREASREAFEVTQPIPNPAVVNARVEVQVEQAGTATVRVLDVAGVEKAVVFDGEVSVGRYAFAIDVSAWAAGVYRVVVEAGGAVVERYLLKTDAALEGQIGLAIYLGQTDAQGRVVVTDSTRFPGLYDVPSQYVTVDETGQPLGSFLVDRSFGLELQDDDEGARGSTQVMLLGDDGAVASITVTP